MTLSLLLDALDRTPSALDLAGRLPVRGGRLSLGGLPGSSGAALVAWLARRSPQRLFTVMATTPAEAERWLSDLQRLSDAPMALYPQREGLGEEEPHHEIAGERVETLQALVEGRIRILVTTARASAERTGVPAWLRAATLRLAPGRTDAPGLTAVVAALEAMGYRRVPTVTEVAEFSVRGGIVDVYGFGMTTAARSRVVGRRPGLAPRIRPHDAALPRRPR